MIFPYSALMTVSWYSYLLPSEWRLWTSLTLHSSLWCIMVWQVPSCSITGTGKGFGNFWFLYCLGKEHSIILICKRYFCIRWPDWRHHKVCDPELSLPPNAWILFEVIHSSLSANILHTLYRLLSPGILLEEACYTIPSCHSLVLTSSMWRSVCKWAQFLLKKLKQYFLKHLLIFFVDCLWGIGVASFLPE